MSPPSDLIALAQAAATRHALDPALVCAVIEQESAWDPHAIRYEPGFRTRYVAPQRLPPTEEIARSISWGLMQVMGQVAREHGFQGKFLSALCDPAVGLDVGCAALAAKLAQALAKIAQALAKIAQAPAGNARESAAAGRSTAPPEAQPVVARESAAPAESAAAGGSTAPPEAQLVIAQESAPALEARAFGPVKALSSNQGFSPRSAGGSTAPPEAQPVIAHESAPAVEARAFRPVKSLSSNQRFSPRSAGGSAGLQAREKTSELEKGFSPGRPEPGQGIAPREIARALELWNGGANPNYASEVLARIARYK